MLPPWHQSVNCGLANRSALRNADLVVHL